MAPNYGPFRTDLHKYYRLSFGVEHPSLWQWLRLWLFNLGFHCVAVYRFSQMAQRQWCRDKISGFPLKVVAVLLQYGSKFVHHVNIEEADFGPGLYIGHVGTIYIGPTKIGANCSLTHNVTIGIGHSEGATGIPSIGDNCWIGTGSVISGAITVGHNVTIANGSILQRSVPDGCLVAGNPARVVAQNYDNSRLFGFMPSHLAGQPGQPSAR